MNGKTAKLLRRGAVLMGVQPKKARRIWNSLDRNRRARQRRTVEQFIEQNSAR